MKRQILNDILSRKPPTSLYHYTTQAGLLGIIEHEEIWATHTQYLNDQREYLHALEMVHEEVHAMIKSGCETKGEELLREMDGALQGLESINVCVCSFSEVRDSLSQWRAYGDATSRFAIGFSGSLLAEATSKQSFYLAQCVYEPSEQRTLIRALIDEVLEENTERTKDQDLPRGGNLGAYLNRFAPILKYPAFAEEREWRVISRPLMCSNKRFDFRPGNSMLIPYYHFSLCDGSLQFRVEEIVVGPTIHPEQARGSVSSLLVSRKLRDVPVINSTVPYRNW